MQRSGVRLALASMRAALQSRAAFAALACLGASAFSFASGDWLAGLAWSHLAVVHACFDTIVRVLARSAPFRALARRIVDRSRGGG